MRPRNGAERVLTRKGHPLDGDWGTAERPSFLPNGATIARDEAVNPCLGLVSKYYSVRPWFSLDIFARQAKDIHHQVACLQPNGTIVSVFYVASLYVCETYLAAWSRFKGLYVCNITLHSVFLFLEKYNPRYFLKIYFLGDKLSTFFPRVGALGQPEPRGEGAGTATAGAGAGPVAAAD